MRSKLKDIDAVVLGNIQVGPALYIVKLEVGEVASEIMPGQFLHLLVPDFGGHILRRPFSIFMVDAEKGTLDILYQVVGGGTSKMAGLRKGDLVNVILPIGNTFDVPQGTKRALLVGGGVGAAPLFMLCERLVAQGVDTEVILGASSKDALVAYDPYSDILGKAPLCSTDDGSFGRCGFATPLVEEALANDAGERFDYVAVCGPSPLMHKVADVADGHGIYCELSMERFMACGIGACLSCVVDTQHGKKRVCVDGPIFNAKEIIW